MKSLDNISIEVVDIIEEMKVLNDRISNTVCANMTDEQRKCYDLGVQNMMSALKGIIDTTEVDGNETNEVEKNRIIYQKYGMQSDVVRYIRLSDVINELYGGD